MKKYLSFFAAALLLAACQSDDIVDQNGVAPKGSIQFALAETKELTRTPGSTVGIIGEDAATKERSISVYGFGVFGCYTGSSVYENTTVTPDFMYNQEVKLKKDGDIYKGTYEPVKYWPNTGKTTFFAYAPYVNKNKIDYEKPYKSHCIAGMSEPYDEGDPWLIYVLAPKPFDNVTGQKDLLIGGCEIEESGNKYVNPWYDMEKPNLNSDPDPMKFTFYHALGLIGDKIKIQMTSELQAQLDGDHNAKVYIDHIDMKFKNLTRKAKLILNSRQNDPNWKPIVSGEVTTTREYTITHQDIVNANSQYEPSADSDFDQTWYKNDADHNGVKETDGVVELLTKKGLLFIPYQVADDPQQVEVTVHYQVLADGMEPFNGVAKSTTNLINDNGKVADILITLGKGLKYDKIYAPQIGDFYYSDGTWGENNPHNDGALPIGCVAYLGDDIGTYDPVTGEKGTAKHGLVIAFYDTKHSEANDGVVSDFSTHWGLLDYDVPEITSYSSFKSAYENDLNGEYNTAILYNRWLQGYSNKKNNYWFAYDCSEYAVAGVGAKGKWHIATFGEWARVLDAMAQHFVGATTKEIETAALGGSMTDAQVFYDANGSYDKSIIAQYEDWFLSLHGHLFSGILNRNKLKSSRVYWTSTEVNNNQAISLQFKYDDLPDYNDGPRFWLDDASWNKKDKNWTVRPFLTF